MIDWYNVFANSLWIIALAFALATISFARFEAHIHGIKLGKLLSKPDWQVKLNLAGLIFCLGLAATSSKTWEQVVWGVMTLLFAFQVWIAARSEVES